MISFDVSLGGTLTYGHKYDSQTDRIQFSGFTKSDAENIMYLAFDNGTKYLIPLTDEYTVDVGSPLTDAYGDANGQLVEMSADGIFVKNSDVFDIFVSMSIPRGKETDISATALATLYAQLYTLYQQIVEQADDFATKEELQEEVEEAVEQYIEEHPIEAPVMSVNTKIGDVVLDASDVGALPANTQYVSSFNGATGAVTYDAPVTSVNGEVGDVDITVPTKTSQLTNDSGFITSAPVQSVNGKTGAVTLTASDVSALPSSTTIPTKTSELTNDSGFITSAPVKKVNNKTGNVVLSASDVGALPSSTTIPTKTSDLTNDSGFLSTAVTSFNNQTGAVTYTAPVTSVNGQTGEVVISVGAVDSVNGQTGTVTVDEVYWCTYGTTTSAQIEAAISAGKLPCVTYNNRTYTLRFRNSSTNHRFICNYGGKEYGVTCQSGTWTTSGTLTFLTSAPVTSVNGQTGAVTGLQTTANLVTSMSSSSTDAQYPSAKSVYDLADGKENVTEIVTKSSSDTTVTLEKDKFYIFPTMATLTVTCPATGGVYAFRFTSGATATTLTMTGITMPDGFMVETNKVYEINVYNGYGLAVSWS